VNRVKERRVRFLIYQELDQDTVSSDKPFVEKDDDEEVVHNYNYAASDFLVLIS